MSATSLGQSSRVTVAWKLTIKLHVEGRSSKSPWASFPRGREEEGEGMGLVGRCRHTVKKSSTDTLALPQSVLPPSRPPSLPPDLELHCGHVYLVPQCLNFMGRNRDLLAGLSSTPGVLGREGGRKGGREGGKEGGRVSKRGMAKHVQGAGGGREGGTEDEPERGQRIEGLRSRDGPSRAV
jgi:hypothetical protein